MTELILYRLNRVPEKNYLAFLNMIGIRLRSPQPARALITFDLVEGAEKQVIKEGTQIATAQAADEDTIIFETQKELVVVGAPLDRCFSLLQRDLRRQLALPRTARSRKASRPSPAPIASIASSTSAISASRRSPTRRCSSCVITAPDHGGRDLARLLEWEYWNGRRWRELRTMQVEVERGEVVFYGPQDMSATQVHGVEDFWVRGRLAEVPQNPWETEIDTAKAIIETAGEGVVPDVAFANLDGGVFLALDLGKNIFPLGQQPKIDQCLYLASREMLSQPEAEVRIEIVLSDATVAPAPVPSEDLIAVVGVLRRQEVAHARQVGPQGDRPLAGEPVGLHRRHQRLHQDRRRHLPRARGHARRRGQRRGQLLGARARRARRLRPARQLHARRRQVGVARRSPAQAAVVQVDRLQVPRRPAVR